MHGCSTWYAYSPHLPYVSYFFQNASLTHCFLNEDPAKALGLQEGDAHVIRNAGGRAIDALRSIIISQQLLGTREVIIIHHVPLPPPSTKEQ